MGSRHDKDKDKGVNVQVLLRCRPFSEDELKSNAPQVISCYEHRREVTVCQNIATKQIDRTFTFDKVFGPTSQQKDLYDQAVIPIVHEVLDGFNCTIFAYGQTGTGKTYTMEGSGRKAKNGELPPDAGVIPRAVQQIFDTLESQHAEYSVKVTFLELYNEEITDLLAPEEFSKVMDDKQRKPLALMEDGKGGVLVRGLEEEIVTSANEIYSLLDRGSAKRRTAETLLNKQSSRSHSIFSITIHIKEATPEGEELIKCGKLNLVDLAGSENISRSGARDSRAREAGEINKSLLTLGRVITALVEHLAHIPYRDSKLTRLLRDSLGGKTKTCIIATVSPSVHCLEETLSTLDYAHRAKNIKNKPEVNQKMMKSALIKDLYGEIERLKAEVNAARDKNGIYLPRERFYQDEVEKKAKDDKIEVMEYELEAKDKQIEDVQENLEIHQKQYAELAAKMEATQKALEQCQEALVEANINMKHAQYTISQHEYVIEAQQQAETSLATQAAQLRSELENAVTDVSGLFAKLERKNNLEAGNRQLVEKFQTMLSEQMHVVHNTMAGSVTAQQKLLHKMELQLQGFMTAKDQSVEQLKMKLDGLRSTYLQQIRSLHEVVSTHETGSSDVLQRLNTSVSTHSSELDQLFARHVVEAELVLKELLESLREQQREITGLATQQREAARLNLDSTRSISRVVLDTLQTLYSGALDFAENVESSSSAHDQSLAQLAEAYEEQAKQEKALLMEGIAEMLSQSMTRKVDLVTSRVSKLRETTVSEAAERKAKIVTFQEVTSSAKEKVEVFVKSSEEAATESASLLTLKHERMDELLEICVKDTNKAEQQWKAASESVQQFERNYIPVTTSLINEGLEANQFLVARSAALNTAVEADIEDGTVAAFALIEDTRQYEHEAAAGLQSIVEAQSHAAAQLESSHNSNVDELKRITEQSLGVDYQDDQPTGSTPSKRTIEVPSLAAINSLRTPAMESLVQEFRSKHSPPEMEGRLKLANGKVITQADVRDFRIPLTTLN
ncbi:kinesin family member 11 [Marchantia polymorpha subsp. ruderalis]|uniref:Kinesin motor domain-containing protein n=2 Tax=Marchantia polymorpha TaxID=3197 RepID=A0A176W369_MARPO|nr:hypothetical protein AXG93_4413s1040 [Marchantia polymorpha subsp. ruderalis]PTQ33596.1 hypothetical protein MARPO_0087s0035 [Marchantia polymorpha]BBN07677.1 hypothetical protein Mp_4g05560 [Marchantia polymorpha subsp. ruderalis]|eukprot:PTQ33596.1 hypothetical protein MARPO_0087s0035 [Marchantia polymorpha]